MTKNKILLILVNPIIYFNVTLKNYDFKGIKWAVCVTQILFGLNTVAAGDLDTHMGRAASAIIDFTFLDLGHKLLLNILKSTVELELYPTLLYNFTNIFFNNEKLFLLISCGVYGYFFGLSLELLLKKCKKQHENKWFWAIFFFFVITHSFVNFQSLRFPAGLKLSLILFLLFVFTNKKKYLLMLPIVGYFHFGLFIVLGLIYASLLVPFKRWGLIVLLVFSFFTGNLKIDDIVLNRIGGNLIEEKKAYIIEEKNLEISIEKAIKIKESQNIYKAVYRQLQKLSLNILTMIFLVFGSKLFRYNKGKYLLLFKTAAVTIIFMNLTQFNIPVLSNRVALFAQLSLFSYLLLNTHLLREFNIMVKCAIGLSLLLLAPFALYQISNTLNFLSISFICFPLVGLFLPSDFMMSIRDFIMMYFN